MYRPPPLAEPKTEDKPAERATWKAWLLAGALVATPLLFGTVATLNETVAGMLSTMVHWYRVWTIVAVVLGVVVWLGDKVDGPA